MGNSLEKGDQCLLTNTEGKKLSYSQDTRPSLPSALISVTDTLYASRKVTQSSSLRPPATAAQEHPSSSCPGATALPSLLKLQPLCSLCMLHQAHSKYEACFQAHLFQCVCRDELSFTDSFSEISTHPSKKQKQKQTSKLSFFQASMTK